MKTEKKEKKLIISQHSQAEHKKIIEHLKTKGGTIEFGSDGVNLIISTDTPDALEQEVKAL